MIEELKADLESSRLENIRLKQQMSEFNSYREAMRFPHDPEFPGIVAIVKLRDYRLTESIIIDRGTNDGITVNRPVYCPEGLVGRTLKVSAHFSKVQPITDPGSVLTVYIEGTTDEGFLRGSSEKNTMILSDLHMNGSGDETVTAQPGMRLLTSGTGKVFPRDLVVGVIESTTAEEGYICRPLADIQSVRSVIVLKTNSLQDEMLSLLVDDE
jgi:rod shape-determining protein MreC